MPSADARRWNARYEQERYAAFERPRAFLVESDAYLPRQGTALDLAMGLGGNAGYLLGRGLRVVGVDISEVGVRQAKIRHPGLQAVVADLTRVALPAAAFDLVLNFFYLQRDLWPAIAGALRPGGILLFETLTHAMLSVHPEIDPQFLLAPGELRLAFPGLETLVYREDWIGEGSGRPKAVASLLARKPD